MSSLPSFFLSPNAVHDRTVIVHDANIIRQMRKVFRLKPGDNFVALDGQGHEYTCVVDTLQREVVRATIVRDSLNARETRAPVILYPSLIRRERFAMILEKCTELGAASFVPIAAERSPYRTITPNLRSRWGSIIREAAEVARRGVLPTLGDVQTLPDALSTIAKGELIVVLSTAQQGAQTAQDITAMMRSAARTHLFLGPEGDYTENEYTLLASRGAIPFSLGPRIVRSETAAIAAIALFTAFL